jgi:hypothetical protein
MFRYSHFSIPRCRVSRIDVRPKNNMDCEKRLVLLRSICLVGSILPNDPANTVPMMIATVSLLSQYNPTYPVRYKKMEHCVSLVYEKVTEAQRHARRVGRKGSGPSSISKQSAQKVTMWRRGVKRAVFVVHIVIVVNEDTIL